MSDETELFAYLNALPFAIDDSLANQPLGDISAVNDLIAFASVDTDAANEWLADKQIELAERRKVLNISKYDTIDALLDCADMFQKAVSTGDKRRIAECLESEFKPDYFTEEFAAGIKLKKTGRNKGEWDYLKTIAINIEYQKQLKHAIETNDFEKKVNFKGEVKNKSAMETARIRTGKAFHCSPVWIKGVLTFTETPRLK